MGAFRSVRFSPLIDSYPYLIPSYRNRGRFSRTLATRDFAGTQIRTVDRAPERRPSTSGWAKRSYTQTRRRGAHTHTQTRGRARVWRIANLTPYSVSHDSTRWCSWCDVKRGRRAFRPNRSAHFLEYPRVGDRSRGLQATVVQTRRNQVCGSTVTFVSHVQNRSKRVGENAESARQTKSGKKHCIRARARFEFCPSGFRKRRARAYRTDDA